MSPHLPLHRVAAMFVQGERRAGQAIGWARNGEGGGGGHWSELRASRADVSPHLPLHRVAAVFCKVSGVQVCCCLFS